MPPLIVISDDENDDNESVASHTFSDAIFRRLPQRSKRSAPVEHLTDYDTETDTEHEAILARQERPAKVIRRSLSHVQVTGPAYPRSAYEGWLPPLRPSREATAIHDLKIAFDKASRDTDDPPDHVYFDLDDFTIYNPQHSRHPGEMATLDRLQNRGGYNEYLVDGTLSVEDKVHFVKGVRFQIMAVGGYGEADVISVRNRISIQSPHARSNDVWFRLGKPSKVYERFYSPFVWLAQFAKFFADYLIETDQVMLHHFRANFSKWLHTSYGGDSELEDWLKQCNYLTDYRTTIAAHVGFLWKECFSIDDPTTGLCRHPIWGEVDPRALDAISRQPSQEQKTIVTLFVFECFKHMYFHEHMDAREVQDSVVLAKIAERKTALGLTPFGASQVSPATMLTPQSLSPTSDDPIDVRVGDVVCIPPEVDGGWRLTSSLTWFAYVQNIRHEATQTLLDVIWLYEPHDTTFGKANYLFTNELFLSDNCGCGRDAIDLQYVTGKVDVTWFAKDPSQHSDLFVRQKFRTVRDEDNYSFTSLQRSDFRCPCSRRIPIFEECQSKYNIGDPVLVRFWNTDLKEDALEPSTIVGFDFGERRVDVRRLVRKQLIDESSRPNELVLSDQIFKKSPSAIIRKCHIRFFSPNQISKGLPTPYDRNGAGDFFYIEGQATNNDDLTLSGMNTNNANRNDDNAACEDDSQDGDVHASTRMSDASSITFPLNEGIDFCAPNTHRKLTGMGIFCGGGNFDRGIEDGGAVKFRYAVDWADRAIHSYRANVDNPKDVQYFLGSVNDYLAMAMAGADVELIARVGDITVICAGSPCPGFSLMQTDRQSFESLRNASMVASVLSYVDVYCPEYLILENVVSMTYGMGAKSDENVFAQILAALVAMGYQVQQFLMDAWNYGSSQSRSRVFIIASAPGLEPLPHPQHSHTHPSDTSTKALGKSSNGLPFGVRRFDYTPFQHVSPAQATADLPAIGDSLPQLCSSHPDHRTPSDETAEVRERVAAIPVRPYGMGIAQAAHSGRLSGNPLNWYEQQRGIKKKRSSKSYSRVMPTRLFRTVTTKLNLQCGMSGSTLHWNEHRSLTVMETKRAQGFLDQDVVIGTPADQIKIIGNSVERNVALMLGLSLRESWASSNWRKDQLIPASRSSPPLLVVAPQPSSPVSDFNGNSEDGSSQRPSTANTEITSSEEEREEIRDDPTHGFAIINRFVSQRKGEASLADSRRS